MSIQSNINQLLTLGAIGGGVVMSSPTMKKRAEIKDLQTQLQSIDKQLEQELKNYVPEGEQLLPESTPAYKEAVEAKAPIAKRIAELDPTQKNVNQAHALKAELRSMSRKEKAEQAAYTAQVDTINTRNDQDEARKIRLAYLKQVKALKDQGKLDEQRYNDILNEIGKGE